jgi:hypothetical protein
MELMKSAKTSPHTMTARLATPLDKQAIIRAVASSTAIETGQSIARIERKLRADNSKFSHVTLAR